MKSLLPCAAVLLGLGCQSPSPPAGPPTLHSLGGQLTLKATFEARGRDGYLALELQVDGDCPGFPSDVTASADGRVLLAQGSTGTAPCTLPKFRAPIPQVANEDLVLELLDSSGAVSMKARAVYAGRTLQLASASPGVLAVGEQATVSWTAGQFVVLEQTTPLVELRGVSETEGGAQMDVLSVDASSVRFHVPALPAGPYKLALDGSIRPAVTLCNGARSCQLVLDSPEVASLVVTVP